MKIKVIEYFLSQRMSLNTYFISSNSEHENRVKFIVLSRPLYYIKEGVGASGVIIGAEPLFWEPSRNSGRRAVIQGAEP